MIYSPAFLGLAVIFGLMVFFWMRSGYGSGRAFGNRIAAHLGIPKHVFHMLVVNGAANTKGNVLKALKKSTPDVKQASVELGPLLANGIKRIETRFGPQEMIDEVKPIVARLVSEFQSRS